MPKKFNRKDYSQLSWLEIIYWFSRGYILGWRKNLKMIREEYKRSYNYAFREVLKGKPRMEIFREACDRMKK